MVNFNKDNVKIQVPRNFFQDVDLIKIVYAFDIHVNKLIDQSINLIHRQI